MTKIQTKLINTYQFLLITFHFPIFIRQQTNSHTRKKISPFFFVPQNFLKVQVNYQKNINILCFQLILTQVYKAISKAG